MTTFLTPSIVVEVDGEHLNFQWDAQPVVAPITPWGPICISATMLVVPARIRKMSRRRQKIALRSDPLTIWLEELRK